MPLFRTRKSFSDPRLEYAEHVIHKSYGHQISIFGKAKTYLKFGKNTAVGTSPATIMTLPSGETDEVLLSANDITHFASADSGDTQTLTVEGHTISGSDLTFVTQNVTLAGQTKTALTTPLARVSRAYNANTTDLTGPVYFAEDVTFTAGVPQTASAIHMIIPAGENQTFKNLTATSSTDYWIVTKFYADVLEKGAAYADVRLETASVGGVFTPIGTISASSNHQGILEFDPLLIIPPNTDVRMRATADGANTTITGGIMGYLAEVS